ncbi:MAG TPA: type II toxin-antitoxin system VapC family toxin [Fimbriiglobus sp.]|nr:type II toxin-antitoxin system VapC family toxin [Fimbriiglobus sp.]
MSYLLDTDHLSILQRPGGTEYASVVANLNLRAGGDANVSVVSFHEQMLGCNDRISQARTAADLVRGYALLEQIITTFTQFTVLPFDDAAATRFLSLKATRLRVSTMDLRIAVTALSRGMTVVTRNVRDFGKVPGLRTEDWTK